MRQVFQKSYLSKELCVEDVPAPTLQGAGVIVRTAASLISPGTERATVTFARKGLLAKVRSQPERVKLLMRKMKQNGIIDTLQLAKRKLESPIAMGYSTAGIVTEASAGLKIFKPGDRVACAGAKYANHAEMAYVPKNLCVPLPDALSFEEGSFVAPGAIALHGVRLAQIGLGESVLIIGLGLIGQLAAQLVRAQGGVPIGVDFDPERLELAKKLGTAHVFNRKDAGLNEAVLNLTDGQGADIVLITAATASHDPVFLAGELCRDRGKVVVVGDVGMNIPRSVYYHKELSVIVSRSYGPGRYDEEYEEQGRDYPKGYVRWSERDNMAAFLSLAAQGHVQLKPLIDFRFAVEDAAQAYDMLANPDLKQQPLGIILEYPQTETAESSPHRLPLTGSTPQKLESQIRLGVIGAGNFLRSTLLPILQKQPRLALTGIATRTGLSAKSAGVQYGFSYCATDTDELLNDNDINAILIGTQSDSHASLVCEALARGKHVFVEKPLATCERELRRCVEVARRFSGLQVMVGFNRRFAPLTEELKKALDQSASSRPLTIHYRVLAGSLPETHWEHQGGGRIVNEVCHFIDWCAYMAQSPVTEVSAQRTGERANFDLSVQLKFGNGSSAQLQYLMRTDGATAATLGKEHIQLHSPVLTAEMTDFKTLSLTRNGKTTRKKLGKIDKGHRAEIAAFADALQTGQPAISFEEAVNATQTTFAILQALQSGQRVVVTRYETDG